MRRRFFVEKFSDNSAILEGDSAHHLARVLRAEPGQLYELSDGKTVFLARVENIGRDAVNFVLLEPVGARANRFSSTLLLSLIKFDRFEWALEKATELGVTNIVPLAAERSEKALIAAAPRRAARWQKILAESAQQARCLQVPQLHQLAAPAEAFKTEADVRTLLSERAGAPALKSALEAEIIGQKRPKTVQVALAIGPEGGWTGSELAQSHDFGYCEASLGANILRTETAVVAGLAALHLYFD